jgi:hypothetical protein
MFCFFSFFLLLAVNPNISQSFLQEIPASVPFHPEWEIPSKDSSLNAVLSQSFTYLGEGHQCIAFESEDGRYVLKMPLQKSPSDSWWHRMPFLAQKHQGKISHRMHKKLIKNSARYLLAFEQLKEETALVYVHLNRTTSLNRKLQVQDKAGLRHIIDLDHVEFFLQKKAQLIIPAIDQWMKEGQIDKAKLGLTNLVKLFYTRFSKGIDDPEQCLEGNFGFLGTEAVQIDIGHIRKQPLDKAVEKEKVQRLLAPLKQQLQSNYPALALHLEAAFQKIWD